MGRIETLIPSKKENLGKPSIKKKRNFVNKMHYYELLIAFSKFKGGFQGSGGLCESSFHPKNFIFFTSKIEQKINKNRNS